VEELLNNCSIDVAIVVLPHHYYLETISSLANRGVHVIKEKPFATSVAEALQLQTLIKEKGIYIGVTVQRRFNPIFQAFHQLKRRIGKIYSIEGRYTMNIASLENGWRSSKQLSGGGALADMGYHYIDLLVWYMGIPDTVTARLSRGNRLKQQYDVEDTAHLIFDYSLYGSYEEKTVGSFIISRVYPQKEEILTVYGTAGIIEVKRGLVRRLSTSGEEIEGLARQGNWPSAAIEQLDFFAKEIEQFSQQQHGLFHAHLPQVAIIEAAYESDRTMLSCRPDKFLTTL
jgi:predicted dehydrogenase